VLTVFPCYAREDSQLVRDLAAFLERGAHVQVFFEEGEIGPGDTIVSKAADGLQAAVILLVLSPGSAAAPWVRPEWEPVLIDQPKRDGVKVGTLLARSCEFPALLRRDAFFDLTQDRLAGFREIKRWLLALDPARGEIMFEPARQKRLNGQDAEMENLRRTLADEPGVAVLEGAETTTLALEFARQSKRDFEGLVWLSCTDQSLASLAGEMALQLGMALDAELEDNLRELGRFCAQRRLLIVLDDAPPDAGPLIPGGRSSALLTRLGSGRALMMEDSTNGLAAVLACGRVPFRPSLVAEIAGLDVSAAGDLLDELVGREMVTQLDVRYPRYVRRGPVRSATLARAHAQAVCRLFVNWPKPESNCEADLPQLRRALDWALSQDDDGAWALACDLAKRGVALLKWKRRQAEAFEILEAVAGAAEHQDDRRMLEDCSREQVWILESWGRMEEAQRLFRERQALCSDQMQFDFE
jgi:TIR domain